MQLFSAGFVYICRSFKYLTKHIYYTCSDCNHESTWNRFQAFMSVNNIASPAFNNTSHIVSNTVQKPKFPLRTVLFLIFWNMISMSCFIVVTSFTCWCLPDHCCCCSEWSTHSAALPQKDCAQVQKTTLTQGGPPNQWTLTNQACSQIPQVDKKSLDKKWQCNTSSMTTAVQFQCGLVSFLHRQVDFKWQITINTWSKLTWLTWNSVYFQLQFNY